MRQEVLVPTLLRRLTHTPNLLMVGLVGGMFCLFHFLSGEPGGGILEPVLPFALLLCHLALSPVPWQWTGDDAPRADLGRGFLQAVAFNLLWVALLLGALHLVHGPRFPDGDRLPPPFAEGALGPHPRPFHPGLGLGLVNVAFALAFGWVSAEKEANEAKERRTAGLLRHAQTRALQNQLEPHVLYNALSGLSELVREDPLAAEEVVVRLAELYRILTTHGNAALIPLGQERRLVEAYLAMEQMRFGDRLWVEWNWPEWADAVLAPPLLLQPLVENAMKHGISPCAEGGTVVISCLREGSAVALQVENTGSPLAPGQRRGVGLGNLEARLALWTETAASLTLRVQDEWTEARLRWDPEVKA